MAEDALAQARAIDVTARTNVLQSFSDLAFEPVTCSQIIRKVRIHEFYRFESVAPQEHTADLDALVIYPVLVLTIGCSRSPAFNLLGMHCTCMACLHRNCDCTDVAAHTHATKTKLAEQLWPSPIVYSALLCLLSCNVRPIFLRITRELSCQTQFLNAMSGAKDRSSSACVVTGALISVGFVLRAVAHPTEPMTLK